MIFVNTVTFTVDHKHPKLLYDNKSLNGHSSVLSINNDVSLLLVSFWFLRGVVGSFKIMQCLSLLLKHSFQYCSLCLKANLPLYGWHLLQDNLLVLTRLFFNDQLPFLLILYPLEMATNCKSFTNISYPGPLYHSAVEYFWFQK